MRSELGSVMQFADDLTCKPAKPTKQLDKSKLGDFTPRIVADAASDLAKTTPLR